MEENKEYSIYKIAEPDGKCFKCSKYCMECDCWLNDLNFIRPEEMEKLQKEIRGNPAIYGGK